MQIFVCQSVTIHFVLFLNKRYAPTIIQISTPMKLGNFDRFFSSV